MKKLIAILLALCLVLALAACGESGGAQNPGGNDLSPANNNTPAPGGNTNPDNGGGNAPRSRQRRTHQDRPHRGPDRQ